MRSHVGLYLQVVVTLVERERTKVQVRLDTPLLAAGLFIRQTEIALH